MLIFIKEHKIFRMAVIFLAIGIILLYILGTQITKQRIEIQEARSFAAAGQNIYQNFEENLRSYQEIYQTIINAIQRVRPRKEEMIVPFVSNLESIGQQLNLEVDIANLEPIEDEVKGEVAPFIKYQISFNASPDQAISYLAEIEKMPYMIKMSSFTYRKIDLKNDKSIENFKNTSIILKLYIKE